MDGSYNKARGGSLAFCLFVTNLWLSFNIPRGLLLWQLFLIFMHLEDDCGFLPQEVSDADLDVLGV